MGTRVYFERGGISRHLPEIRNYGKKVLLVSGRQSIFKTGLFGRITGILSREGIDYVSYAEVNPEPAIRDVEKGAAVCRDNNCDCVLGVGGGSPMDAAKAIAVLATNGGKLQDYFGEVDYKMKPLPVVAVPTTCGTGSEVTRFSVIMDRDAQTKKTVSSEDILPRLSILDADTLESLPPHLVTGTGMDAFSHSAESFLSRRADPLSRLFAKESLRILWKFLPKAKSKKIDMEVKENIFFASFLAGLAINKTGTIIVHGMGYSLTVTRNIHHGTANALLLPYVFEYLKENGYHDDFRELEGIWGDTCGLKGFVEALGLPSKLAELGIREESIEKLAELSEQGTKRANKNMKTPLGKKEFREILLKAL